MSTPDALVKDIFPNVVAKDFFETLTSHKLGEGAYRTVYKLTLNPDLVVKLEDKAFHFSNVYEWDVWERIKHTEHVKWFAPCEHISPCGTVLVQKFAKDIEDDFILPAELPVFFTDISKRNFGIYEGRVVCRDYGNNLLMEKGMSKRMKKVEW